MTQSALLVMAAGGLVLGQLASLAMRRALRDYLPYVLLLCAAVVALVIVHELHRDESLPGFVAIGAALLLAVVPRILEGAEARAAQRGDVIAALRWVKIAELFVPGRALARRRRSLESVRDLVQNGIAAIEPRLRRELIAAAPADRPALALDLAHLLMLASRLDDAVAVCDEHVPLPALTQRPSIAAMLLRAHLDAERWPEAMRTLAALEAAEVTAPPGFTELLFHCRLLFLANAGHEEALRVLFAGPVGRVLQPSTRQDLLVRAIKRIADSKPPPPEVATFCIGVAQRTGEPFGLAPLASRYPIVTFALLAANLAVFAFVDALVGRDELALARAGALFRPVVLEGEWWRLFTAPFLHAGVLHLAINLFGLWALGRICEAAYGHAALLAIYLGSALCGTGFSILFTRDALSVGSSGALFGLVGALGAALLAGPGRFSPAQRQLLSMGLGFLVLLQFILGLRFEFQDNAVHLGGLVSGFLFAFPFAPRTPKADDVPHPRIARVLAALLLLATIVAGGLTAARPLATTLLRLPMQTVRINGFTVEVPRHFVVDAKARAVVDRYLGIALRPTLHDDTPILGTPQANDARLRPFFDHIAKSLTHVDKTETEPDTKPEPDTVK